MTLTNRPTAPRRRLATTVAAAIAAIALLLLAVSSAAADEPVYDFERYLNIRSAWGGSFSPDGRSIVFMTSITGVTQAFRIPVAGGWPEQLTFTADGVDGVGYSPTKPEVIVSFDKGGDEKQQLLCLSDDGSRALPIDADTAVIHLLGNWSWKGDRIAYSSNARDERHFDIYVADVATGKTNRLLTREATNTVPMWSRDDRYLIVSRSNSNVDNDLLLVDAATGDTTLLTKHTGMAQFLSPDFTKDSRRLLVISDLDREFLNLAQIDLATGDFRFLEDKSWDMSILTLSDDGRVLAKGYNVDGFTELHLVDLETGEEIPVPETPPGVISGLKFSKDSKKILFTLNGPDVTADVWTYDLASRELTQVTHSSLAGIPRDSFVRPTVVRFPSFDKIEIPGLLYLPKGAKKGDRLPTIVNVHGGPEAQATAVFSKQTQYYLHRGYAVYYPNVRGSTGYGKTYTHLDDVHKRMDSVKDLAEAARWLAREGYADEKRIAVMGGSYGGFMTLAALTNYPELWAAGVDIVGIANFVSFLENTGSYRKYLRTAEYGDPETDLEFLKEISPLTRADRIVAPLFVIQGANDPRVPRSEAEQIVSAVKSRGGDVEYLLFEDEGHGVAKIPNQIKAYTRIGDFLDVALGPQIGKKKKG
jgi:dipeptidyl aminopeptidase/acylaminoacyl peptidase